MFSPLSKPASGFAQRQGVSTLPESYHRGRSVSNALGRAALSTAAVHSQRRGGAGSPGGSCAPPAPARRLLRHCAVRRVASIRNGYVVLTADQTKPPMLAPSLSGRTSQRGLPPIHRQTSPASRRPLFTASGRTVRSTGHRTAVATRTPRSPTS